MLRKLQLSFVQRVVILCTESKCAPDCTTIDILLFGHDKYDLHVATGSADKASSIYKREFKIFCFTNVCSMASVAVKTEVRLLHCTWGVGEACFPGGLQERSENSNNFEYHCSIQGPNGIIYCILYSQSQYLHVYVKLLFAMHLQYTYM